MNSNTHMCSIGSKNIHNFISVFKTIYKHYILGYFYLKKQDVVYTGATGRRKRPFYALKVRESLFFILNMSFFAQLPKVMVFFRN